MNNQTFYFVSYSFDPATKVLDLHYAYDGGLKFTETYHFDFPFVDYDTAALDRAFQQLFFIAGVSYYKLYVPKTVEVLSGTIDQILANFLNKTYQRGLGEFFYVNKLDPKTPVSFPVNSEELLPVETSSAGLVVGIGGGKDSLLSVELLRSVGRDVATWSLNHRPQLTPLVERVGTEHFWVDRTWDLQIARLTEAGAYNGHIPISAIFATVGTIVAILSGRQDNVVSNEQSANEPTLEYRGVEINHQYSKSQEFEQDYATLLQHSFGSSQRYYSLLRPLSELRIAELFAMNDFAKYSDVFSSCNRAFTQDSDRLFWCGTCAKCAFVFMLLTPFVEKERLCHIFDGKNLLQESSLVAMYKTLLGIKGDKPLDCVGEIQESRAAMDLAKKQYPELADIYSYDVDDGYDFRKLAPYEIPEDIWSTISNRLSVKR